MGKPVPNYMAGDLSRKMMPLGIVMDERICTGYEYAAFCHDFRRILRDPEVLTYFCYNSGNRGVFMEDWRKDVWLSKN